MKKMLLILFGFLIVFSNLGCFQISAPLGNGDDSVGEDEKLNEAAIDAMVVATIKASHDDSGETEMLNESAIDAMVAATIEAGNADSGIEYLEDYIPNVKNELLSSYEYSEAQLEVIRLYGEPLIFQIVFDSNGRMENWLYFRKGTIFTFLNGALFDEVEIEKNEMQGYESVYSPSYFVGGMSKNGLMLVTGERDGIVISIDEIVDGGELVYVKGLSAGFVNGALRFVENVSLEIE